MNPNFADGLLERVEKQVFGTARSAAYPQARSISLHDETVRGVKALINITGDGLLNLVRVAADVGFEIDRPIEPHPIFPLIQRHAGVDDAEMFEVFNMGTGFCVVVAPSEVAAALDALRGAGEEPVVAGSVTDRPGKYVSLPAAGLLGRGDVFEVARDTV